MNRLAEESSPYLRQHADNPVDWYPWGPEAFERAQAEDKPILLSVGYSSCHWCHVMAHESFEHAETAAVMNDLFVNIKVDREERPDVDSIYMTAVQAMTGRGGWPMTVFLTPDGHPFFAGTYFPVTERHGMPSFRQVMRSVHDVWHQRRDDVLAQAGQLTRIVTEQATMGGDDRAIPGADRLDEAATALRRAHDPAWGGFGGAPKFPQPMTQEFLLTRYRRTGDDDLLSVVTTTLDAMASGGIYDHLGGGFARYSVDAQWIVPHFEKMLYDNAQLARLYLHAWQVTGRDRYRLVLEETVGYLLSDLHDPGGGFYSSEDADSEGEEGRFYVFTLDEVREALAAAGLAAHVDEVVEWYGFTEAGNFEGRNIPTRPVRGDLARPPVIESARQALFEARSRRERPGLDDKVLTEWNGLALATLAEAAAATGNNGWLDEARRCATFLCDNLRQNGRWLRSWQPDAGARHLAYSADYAAMVDAFVRLAEATGEARWIREAVATADDLVALFSDDERGGLYTTGSDAEALITRPKDVVDNALPSANSLAALALLRLAALTGESRFRERAEDILALLGPVAVEHPTGFGHLLLAVEFHVEGGTEIAVVGERPDLVAAVQRRFLPTAVLAWGDPFPSPLWEGRAEGAAYVCRDFTCDVPARDVDTLQRQLDAA